MALIVKDRVQETTATVGTIALVLTGAVSGFQPLSSIGNGNTTYYCVVGGTEWEVGIGTYTLIGTILSRDTILASSNGGSAVNFSAGVKNVFVTYPAGKSVTIDDVQTLTNKTLTRPTMSVTGAGLTLQDATDNTKQANFDLSGLTTGTTYAYTLPTVTGSALATLGNISQTFAGATTFSNTALTFGNSTSTSTVNISNGATASGSTNTIAIGASGLTGSTTAIAIGGGVGNVTTTMAGTVTATGNINFNGGGAVTTTIGNTSTTGTITLGRSTVSQTTNIQAGATASGSTKTLNIGTGGLAGSTTAIAIGSTAGTSTTTLNGTVTFSTPLVATNMVQATTSTSGYLSSTDWNTFNGKQPAGSYVTVNGALGTPSSGTLTNCTFPTLNQDTTGTASNVTGTVAIANGGTGATSAATALTALGAYSSTNPSGYTSNTGTVTSVSGTGTASGLTLSGTVTSSGSLTLSGTASVAALSTASGSAPSYSARAWVNFDGTGTVAIRASANVSSITDHGVGQYTVNFTTAMDDANYSSLASVSGFPANRFPSTPNMNTFPNYQESAPTTAGFRFFTGQFNTSVSGFDQKYVCAVAFR